MAIQTWYLRQITVGGAAPDRLWWDEDPNPPAQAQSVTGWNVGAIAAARYADLSNGTEVARGTFATTVLPNTTAPTVDNSYAATAVYTPPDLLSSTDSISTLYEYNGYFPAGNWVFTFPMRGTTAVTTYTHDGLISMRVFKGVRSGTAWASVTELTSARLQGTAVTNINVTTVQSSVVTWAAPIIRLNNEFLICKIAWEITGAGTGNNTDVNFRYGQGCTMVSPVFRKRAYAIT